MRSMGWRQRLGALVVVGLVSACAPPLEGAACVTHEHCPAGQACTEACTCALGAREGGRCAGFAQTDRLELDGPATSSLVQLSSNGAVAAVFTSSNRRGQPEVRVVRREADRSWSSSTMGFELPPGQTQSPMGLSPAGERIAVPWASGARLYTLSDGGVEALGNWPGVVPAVALAGPTLVGMVQGRGVCTTVARVTSGDLPAGDVLDPAPSTFLRISEDGARVGLLTGSDFRLYVDASLDNGAEGVSAFALSGDGRTWALVLDGGVEVRSGSYNPKRVPVAGATSVTLDGRGEVLFAVTPGGVAVFRLQLDPVAWVKVGELPVAGVTSVAVTFDGRIALVATPAAATVLEYSRRW